VKKLVKVGDKNARLQQDLLDRIMAHLDTSQAVRSMELTERDIQNIRDLHLLTQKPMLYIANVEEDEINSNNWLPKLEALAVKDNAEMISVCAVIESELVELDEEGKLEFLQDLGLQEPGLNRIIHAGYKLLGLQTFFTARPKEARAWTICQGDSAPKAAGTIHTDFEHGFIRAEVIAFDDYVSCHGEQGAKDAGKWRLEGKDYVVTDGDVMLFRFNV